jgi:hypothetical protein
MGAREHVGPVVCGGCQKRMRRDRVLALVQGQFDGVTPWRMVQFTCDTPDCGTTVQVEEDMI